jgi:transcriptional regulator with XRE-family HTH domain
MSSVVPNMVETLVLRRNRLRLSQRAVGRRAGISWAQYGRIERGEHSPTLRTAEKIAAALETTVAALWPSVNVATEGEDHE